MARVRRRKSTRESQVAARPEGWPDPLGPAAYHGPLGQLVKRYIGNIEGDPAATLIQKVVAAGNQMGRGLHFMVQGSEHWTNEYCAVVGATSRARKGTSQSPALADLRTFDPKWAEAISGGLSSGEGLIYHVRDGTWKGNEVEDQGVADKRLLVTESEFASVIKRMSQDSNTLSIVLRQAWDGETLATKTRNRPLLASDAHISVIAHVTEVDLKRLLVREDIANGFGNRFLWVLSQRAAVISQDNGWTPFARPLEPLIRDLRSGIKWSENHREMKFDPQASAQWDRAYRSWAAEDREWSTAGDDVTARAEAHVRRLAMIYAGLDCSPTIGLEHLRAALEVWRYCDESARYLFGDAPNDPDGARMLRIIRAAGGEWIARNEIGERTKSQFDVEATGRELVAMGLVEVRQLATRGRPRTEYRMK